jgi:nicotinate-nucleotide adenylyltransferase
MTKTRLGIYGGTFDPPHVGHLILAAEATDQLELSRVLWVLTPEPPHKKDQRITPLADRLDMLQAAIRENPLFELSRVEIERPGPHYSVDTLRILRQQHQDATLVFLIGGDSLHDLPTWHQPRAVVEACDEIGVMRRPGEVIDLAALDADYPGLASKVKFLDAPLVEISSHDIRRRVARGHPFRYHLPEGVYRVIQSRRLYRDLY